MSADPSKVVVIYGLDDKPPLPKAFVLALQHVLTMFGATVAVPLLLGPAMGMTPDQIGILVSSVMICSGVATLLQVTIGSRLPIIQGVSFSFLGAFFFIIGTVARDSAVAAADKGAVSMQYIAGAIMAGALIEAVVGFSGLMGKLRKVLTPVVIGPVIMLIGLALFPFGAPWAGLDWPVAGVVIALIIVFSLVLAKRSRIIQIFPILLAILIGYGICSVGTATGLYRPRLTLLSASEMPKAPKLDDETEERDLYPSAGVPDYLVKVSFPPNLDDAEKKRELRKASAAGAAALGGAAWVVEDSEVAALGWERITGDAADWGDWIAVKSALVPQGFQDAHVNVGDWSYVDVSSVGGASWVKPYNQIFFPWGWPKWSLAFFFAVLAGFMASMIESFGDYHACSVMAGGGDPTPAQVSRGIGSEGLGCFSTGILGGFSSTSYSENIGLVGITKVGSRYVVMIGAFILLGLGFLTKLGALVATMPRPIVGALYCALFGLISAVGIQQLSKADLRSDRNLMIAGFSLFMGLSVPAFFSAAGDRVVGTMLLWLPEAVAGPLGEVTIAVGSSGMAVAAILGLILDNVIPGTAEERGIAPEQTAPGPAPEEPAS